MADDKKKKKKIIAGIIGSAALIGGATGGILASIETEAKEGENEEENNPINPVKNVPTKKPDDDKVELSSALSESQRDLGVFESSLTKQQIKTELIKKGIDASQVIVTVNSNTEATVAPIQGSTKYKGNSITVSYRLDTRQTLDAALPESQRDLGVFESSLTKQQIKTELIKKGIDASQVSITVMAGTEATVTPIQSSTKYRGNSIKVSYRLDTRQTLAAALPESQRNLDVIETNGEHLTEQMIKERLPNIDWKQAQLRFNTHKSVINGSVTIQPTSNSTKYKGNSITVSYRLDTRQTLDAALPESQRNLGVIETNGSPLPNVQQIKTELIKKHIDTSQVIVTVNSNTEATVTPIQGSTKYKGNSITVKYTVDDKIDLASKLSGWQPTIIAVIGKELRDFEVIQQIETELTRKGIDTAEVSIVDNSSTKRVEINVIPGSRKYKNNFITSYTLDFRSNSLPLPIQGQPNFGTTVNLINTYLVRETFNITMPSTDNTKEKVFREVVEQVKKYLSTKKKRDGTSLIDNSLTFSHRSHFDFKYDNSRIFDAFTTRVNNKALTTIIFVSDSTGDRRPLDIKIFLTLT